MDKNKIIEAAAKLVAKGAYDKAIKEYQKILDVDPKDVRILQKMGELYQKKSDNSQAAAYFTKVAESYTADGFFLKAVALYKQVLKLDPGLIEVNLKLAELHQQLQLLGEAMAYFQIVANHYDKAGDARRSLDVLRKMVDLDPDNVPSRRKLADLYVREGLQAEGAGEYRKAAEHLKRQNRTDDYLQVAERLSSLEPENLGLARELAELYLQRNDQKRALAKLQVCFKADSRDIDTLRLLAVAFQGLGQISKTISVHKELAKAYEEKGQNREAEQTWAQVAQLDPNDPDVMARRQAVAPPPVTSAAPAHSPARPVPAAQPVPSAPIPVPMTAPPVAAKPRGDNLGKLLTETDVYVKYGLHDKALEHLRKVFAIDPENIDAHEKAYAIYVASNNQAQASEQLLNVLRLHTMRGDAPRAQPYLSTMLQQNPGHPEVPAFLQVLRVHGATGLSSAHGEAEVAEDAILVDSADDEVIVADDPHEDLVPGDEALTDEPALDAEPLLAPEDAAEAAAYEFEPPPVPEGDVAPGQVVADQLDEPLGTEESATGEHMAGGELLPEDVAAAGMADEPFSQTQDTDIPVAPAALAAEEEFSPAPALEAQDEAFAPPLLGDDEHERPTGVSPRFDPDAWRAASAAGTPEESFADLGNDSSPGASQDLASPEAPDLEPLPPESGTATEVPPDPSLPPETTAEYSAVEPAGAADEALLSGEVEEEPVQAPPEDDAAGEECEEAAFFLEQGLFEEAREILETVLIAFGDHPRATELMQQLEAAVAAASEVPAEAGPAEEAPAEGRDAFDLAQELAEELGGYQEPEPEAAAAPSGDDYQVSVEEVFAEFKKGLEKVVKPEDVDTHYDLGIAYKEMGLIEDAIGEFTVARKGCLGKRKEIDCLTMIGMLQMVKGDAGAAVESYQLGISSEAATGDTGKALRYELATAWEATGQAGKALFQYLKVQEVDANYRDVAAQVGRLSVEVSPEDDAPVAPPPRKAPGGAGGAPTSRKVGYV